MEGGDEAVVENQLGLGLRVVEDAVARARAWRLRAVTTAKVGTAASLTADC
jgi:hypothetical protein